MVIFVVMFHFYYCFCKVGDIFTFVMKYKVAIGRKQIY